MTHRRLLIAAAIIAIILIVGFMLSVPHTRDVIHPSVTQSKTNAPPAVELHDIFKKGTHTISGTIEAPDACATVTAGASLVGDASSTQGILITISVPKNTEVCLQLPTTKTFSTTIAAPAHTPITATVNGSEANVTVL